MKQNSKQIKLLISILSPFIAGFIGSTATFPAISSWYVYLNKPFFSPPNWLFGPVWTLLYLLMGISLYLVWNSKKKNSDAVKLFFAHLIINLSWSIAFFGLKNVVLAMVVIIILWLMIVRIIQKFYVINKTAAYLLVPYILWVSFASLLNFAILVLN